MYGCKACYASREPSRSAGINTHTGVDVRPAGLGEFDFSAPVLASADGWVEALLPFGESTGGLGNTVILRHANGMFSVYGHLDLFEPGLVAGEFVAQGAKLGIMGNSGLVLKGSTLTHVHFEVKATPTAGNVRGAHEYFGYTPGHPDYEGYEDPRDLVDGIAVEAIPETALRVLAPGPVLVRASPGEIYSPGVPTAVTDRIDAGTAFVAFKHAVAEGRDWYFIDLPSRNRPLQGSYYPNNGPTGGWVDAALVAIEPAGAQAEIHRDGAFIRSRPRSSARLLARAYSAQRFVVSGAPKRSPGVSCTWYPVDLPEGLPVVLGWICGRSLALLSAGSASSP